MKFREDRKGAGRLVVNGTKARMNIQYVYCFPFYSMMLALNRTHIDYFSLDVEGLELEILRTIPFDKLNISVFTVEQKHGKDKAAYTHFMRTMGYYLHSKILYRQPNINLYVDDLVFVKKQFH